MSKFSGCILNKCLFLTECEFIKHLLKQENFIHGNGKFFPWIKYSNSMDKYSEVHGLI